MNAILYTTHCPKCRILESKLKSANISYETCADQELMVQKGFMSVPVLEVDEKQMQFETAVKWVNERANH